MAMAMNMHVRIANVLGKQGGSEHVRRNAGRSHFLQGHLAVRAFNARAHSSIYIYIFGYGRAPLSTENLRHLPHPKLLPAYRP